MNGSILKELYIDSVAFCYDARKPLLTGGFLHCKVGEIVALIGRNGCGKSTLMKILFGALKAKHSYIRLNGKRIEKPFLSKEVCYLPQDRFLPTAMRVREAVRLMIPEEEKRVRVLHHAIIERVKDNLVADLSGGECRFLEIVLLLHQPATFILLDEPFSGLSPIIKDEVAAQISSFRVHKGIVVSDHDYHSTLSLCTKMVLLQNGTCRTINDKKELEMFYVPEGTFSDHNQE